MNLLSCESLALMVGCWIEVLVLPVEVVVVVLRSLGALVGLVEVLRVH